MSATDLVHDDDNDDDDDDDGGNDEDDDDEDDDDDDDVTLVFIEHLYSRDNIFSVLSSFFVHSDCLI